MKLLIELWLRPFCQGIVGTAAALLGIGLASTAGSVASGIIGSKAAGKAADAQASAAEHAADITHLDAQAALDFQKQQYQDAISRMQPWLRTGAGANSALGYLLGMSPQYLDQVTPVTPSQAAKPATPPSWRMLPQNPTAGSDIVPSMSGGGGNPIIANRYSALASRMDGGSPQDTPFPGNPDANNFGSFGPAQFTGDPNDPNNPMRVSGSPEMVPRQDLGPVSSSGGVTGPGQLPFGFLSQIWDKHFTPPDEITEQNDPGFKARMKFGTDALERSAAARGNLLTGGEAKNLDQFAQDFASNEYGNIYNRRENEYLLDYNQFKQNQNDIFNRYATLAGYGQTAAGSLNSTGLTTGAQVGNTLLTEAGQIGNDIQNAGAARASGYVGGANAITGAINNGISSTADLLALYKILQKNG